MKPTPDQIAQALQHVFYEIQSFLQTPEYDHSNKALEESVYFRKMAHCRVLYDFFTTKADDRNGSNDDIVSEDFGFPIPTKELYGDKPRELLDRFNKDLFHLTYDRLKRTPKTKPWPMDCLFPPVAQRSREFIDHILTRCTIAVSEAEIKLWSDLKAAVAAQPPPPLQQNTSNIAPPLISVIEVKRGS
jgi:hypothetical protein